MNILNIVPDGHNKSTYFVLPFLGLSKFSFGSGGNFQNSYVSFNGKIVSVVKKKEDAGEYWTHPNYLTDFDLTINPDNKGTAIIYSVPSEFESDLSLFLDGKYSKFSEVAKEAIRLHSGLPYKVFIPGSTKVSTHNLLLVLEKHKVLKKWIEDKLGTEIPEEQELLEKPDHQQEYMDIDTVII